MKRILSAMVGVLCISLKAWASVPCETGLNVLFKAWDLGAVKASSHYQKDGTQVVLSGHDSPSAKKITITKKNGNPPSVDSVITVNKSNCLMETMEIKKDGPNLLKTPVVVDRQTCRNIFQHQQLEKYRPWEYNQSEFEKFNTKVLSQSVAGWAQITDPEVRHVWLGRVVQNCGQSSANAGVASERIGALGFLSWDQAALSKYFVGKDEADRKKQSRKPVMDQLLKGN